MKDQPFLSGCACCGVSRRHFIAGCTACIGGTGFLATPAILRAAQPARKLKLRIVYSLHGVQQVGPDWPNKGFNFEPVMKRINTELARRCDDFEFVTALANGPEQAQKIVEEDKSAAIDGYIVYQMNCWNRVVQTIAGTGKPVLYADFHYGGSGGFLVYTAGFLRSQAPNVGFVASSDIKDLVQAVNCFGVLSKGGTASDFVLATAKVRSQRTPKPNRKAPKEDQVDVLSTSECLARMKESRILAVRGTESGPGESMMGIPLEHVAFAELNDAWKNANRDEAIAVAACWKKSAALVEGVSDETLQTSAAMYLAMKSVLKKHGANAITVNCLGGFYGGHIHAYPCLGFHELLNEGLVGACECDVRSTATMVAMTALTKGRPGYISDPVIDTSKRQIIYAHCVASNRPFGPAGKTNPFQILTHSEDRQGASVRSVLPVDFMTTTVEFAHEKKQVLFHRGKAVENDPDDRACRTKIAAEPVGDIEKLFTQWDQWGWHRVTYYGDLKDPVFALADALDYKVVEET